MTSHPMPRQMALTAASEHTPPQSSNGPGERDGIVDFVNGTRLVYPMEGEAMRFLYCA